MFVQIGKWKSFHEQIRGLVITGLHHHHRDRILCASETDNKPLTPSRCSGSALCSHTLLCLYNKSVMIVRLRSETTSILRLGCNGHLVCRNQFADFKLYKMQQPEKRQDHGSSDQVPSGFTTECNQRKQASMNLMHTMSSFTLRCRLLFKWECVYFCRHIGAVDCSNCL